MFDFKLKGVEPALRVACGTAVSTHGEAKKCGVCLKNDVVNDAKLWVLYKKKDCSHHHYSRHCIGHFHTSTKEFSK